MTIVRDGIPASPGIVIGPAYVLRWEVPRVPHVTVSPEQVESEVARFDEARAWARDRIREIQRNAAERLGDVEAQIFEPQILMLDDPELVDGTVAFTGGAGVADWWYRPVRGRPTWRDTMARIEGPVAAAMQGTFAENWLEACGEILTGPRHWPALAPAGNAGAMLVKSSPSDRATVSRVVFQMLIEGAVTSVDIATPYFLPDRAFRRALVRAARRGVRVRVVVPGRHTDQRWVRLASRRMYRELLEGGVRIFEYRPAMTHVKAVMVDGVCAMIGTTNIDNRSFEHNDELNVAFREKGVTARLGQDFEADLAASDEVTLDLWIFLAF